MRDGLVLEVAADGSAEYASVMEALAAVARLDAEDAACPEAGPGELPCVTVRLAAGTYRERVEVTRPNVTIEGAGAERTRIVLGLGAKELNETGEPLGTFRTYTMRVAADGVCLRDLTVENDAGDGREVGQAIALYADGDRLVVEGCRLLGRQDTLFVAPLPAKENQPGGFRGPGEGLPRRVGRQWYRGCLIAGDVDFIFGGGTAWFEGCEVRSIGRADVDPEGYVTAASTPRQRPFGLVFHECRFTTDAKRPCSPQSVYLGRPWREHARTALLDCELGAHVRREGWFDWGKPLAHDTATYLGSGLSGAGFVPDAWPEWTTPGLTPEDRAVFTRDAVLAGWDPGEGR